MVIDSIFVYHFADPDLKVEVISRKEGTAENGGIDFERLGETGKGFVGNYCSKAAPDKRCWI